MKVKVTIPVIINDGGWPGEISFIADLKANVLSTTDFNSEIIPVIGRWEIKVLKED